MAENRMQVAILSGGVGSRLRPLFSDIPKAMAPVDGVPFFQYQLDLLRSANIYDVLVCAGHKADQIMSHFGDGGALGMNLRYSVETKPLGTAGALKLAEPLLEDAFFVLYGDSYLMLDYEAINRAFVRQGALAMMVVFHNKGKHDRSNVELQGDRVARYSKSDDADGMEYIDEGLTVMAKQALDFIPAGEQVDLEFLFTTLVDRNEVGAYETSQRFYEIGSPEGFAEFESFIRARGNTV